MRMQVILNAISAKNHNNGMWHEMEEKDTKPEIALIKPDICAVNEDEHEICPDYCGWFRYAALADEPG